MTIRSYKTYKDTGVCWLGSVPSHWKIDRLKRSMIKCQNGIWGDEPKNDVNDLICIRVADFDRVRLRVDISEPTIRNISENDQRGRIVASGNLLIEKSGGGEKQPVGAVVLYDKDIRAVCSNFVAKITLAENMEPSYWRYLHSFLYSNRLTIRSINQTSGIQNLDQQRYFDETVAFPPEDEQSAIALFLDRETTKIDALIEEQQRLIELLKEKRQAVISYTVTKGLDPSVPMKDSGVEWLGQVPAHWEVKRLRFACDITTGTRDTANAIEDGEYPFFVRSQDVERINSFSYDCEAVLTAGDGAGVGKVFHYFNGKFDFHQRVYLFYNFRNILGPFFFHYLKENFYKVALEGGAKSTVDSLRRPLISNFPICIPPIREQTMIVDHVVRVSSQYDELMTTALDAITLLQERRTALVSAAVTGKIDVRGFVSDGAEAA